MQRLEADLAAGRHAEVVGELESLAAQYPFREVLWGQLMLALYRSGRQAEALLAFDRARRTLAEELGVDPGAPLTQLHQQIVQQDPSLEIRTESAAPAAVATPTSRPRPPPATQVRRPPPRVSIVPDPRGETISTSTHPRSGPWPPQRSVPRRRALIVGALTLAVLLGAVFIPRVVGGGGDATIASGPGTALIDLQSGKVIASIPLSQLAVAAYPVFADGHFWVNNFSPTPMEIEPKTGRILRQVNPPARPVEGSSSPKPSHRSPCRNTLWVGSGHDLVKMDVRLGRAVDRFRLDDYVGGGSGLAEGVAVGGGSVWVSRDVGQGQIVRLDPSTGEVQHRFDDMNPYLHLAYGDGALWAADESLARAADERGIARIDAATNTVTRASAHPGKHLGCGGWRLRLDERPTQGRGLQGRRIEQACRVVHDRARRRLHGLHGRCCVGGQSR